MDFGRPAEPEIETRGLPSGAPSRRSRTLRALSTAVSKLYLACHVRRKILKMMNTNLILALKAHPLFHRVERVLKSGTYSCLTCLFLS